MTFYYYYYYLRYRTWSDREIRTLLTRIYGVPLNYRVLMEFESFILNCSKYYDIGITKNINNNYERYSDSVLVSDFIYK